METAALMFEFYHRYWDGDKMWKQAFDRFGGRIMEAEMEGCMQGVRTTKENQEEGNYVQ